MLRSRATSLGSLSYEMVSIAARRRRVRLAPYQRCPGGREHRFVVVSGRLQKKDFES